ncbi:Transcriptional repressor nrdR [Stanieria cyanosphaera PCC 7437]|uniref:Transcriptional repressor NrdR n=1 Tax=Stanieria cyanosphaera (strain ATCC 29371 / PCC 7437) TaxID=111780 RepID=K9XXZ8_STAC7|nr:transcriptional regulator NrdR [Stanieria cyanosphaera]AFZ37475.1 Transcriptional repressor nrdR [Stanieria cyanosphaera PCC 7437]
MQCPYCQSTESRVLESRSTEGGQSIRRRRECLRCKHRFTTYERIEFVPITVIKRDGNRESFDRSKLIRGMIRACEKTEITYKRIEAIVDEIEAQLQQSFEREFTTNEIGELVLKYLRQENEVAYVRFASVYRKFKGIKDFVETLNHLQKEDLNNSEDDNIWQNLEQQNASTPLLDCIS